MGIVYLNNQYMDAEKAQISVFDRGVLFDDSIYEVIPVYNGQPFFLEKHLWITSTTKEIFPATQINNHLIGNGTAGPCWETVYHAFKKLTLAAYV